MKYVIGFDVGGTRLKSGAVTLGGRLLAPGVQPSGFTLAPGKLIEALAAEVRRIAQRMGHGPQAIGLGLPGAVDPGKGAVLLPGKIKGLEGFPIVPELQCATGVPVVAENDGRISMFAESCYGLARNHDWALTLTIGTGVGSGVKLAGRILRDPHLQFGTQMSHIVLQSMGGRLCVTGARGTAEMLCSATALAMAVRDGLQRGIPSTLSDRYFADPHAIDFQAVMRGVSQHDRLCLDELRHWTTNLGWLLVSAVHVYAPEVIVLSGGALRAAKYFLGSLQEQVNRYVFRYPAGEGVPILVSRLREHSGVLGAAALAWEQLVVLTPP